MKGSIGGKGLLISAACQSRSAREDSSKGNAIPWYTRDPSVKRRVNKGRENMHVHNWPGKLVF